MLMKWTYHVKNLSDHLQHITRTKTQKKQQQKSDTYLTAYLCIYVQDLFQTFNFFYMKSWFDSVVSHIVTVLQTVHVQTDHIKKVKIM